MRRLRDVFYINANFEEQSFIYYGMEFQEFIKYCPVELENLLITDGQFITNGFNYHWNFETAEGKEGILELTEEDIYGLGNFHWIDYSNEEALNQCTPEEQAEVLYLSHFCKPLKSPFFDRINNQFVYLAHDDGWFCKLYCRDLSTFKEIIANKIIGAVSTNKRRKIYPMSDEVKNQLFEFTKEGLLIDFSHIFRDSRSVGLYFYVIGHYKNMDEMYNNLERNKQRAKVRGYLEHKNKQWKIDIC